VWQNCTVLLFNDMVVLAVKKKNKYQAKSGKITLRGSYVWEDRAVKNGFTLVGREAADKITVEAATEQEKVRTHAVPARIARTAVCKDSLVSRRTDSVDGRGVTGIGAAPAQLSHRRIVESRHCRYRTIPLSLSLLPFPLR
jgi:hypothetical protein